MLLGQIVAISFAQSLFYLAILLSPRVLSRSSNTHTQSAAWVPHIALELVPLMVSLVGAVAVPYVVHSANFLTTLLIPHVLLFVPALIDPRFVPKSWGSFHSSYDATSRYRHIFAWLFAIGLLLQGLATYMTLGDNSPVPLRRTRWSCALENAQHAPGNPWERLLGTMFEHPAVTSVSWDVIFCAVQCFAWAVVNQFDTERMLGEEDPDVGVHKKGA